MRLFCFMILLALAMPAAPLLGGETAPPPTPLIPPITLIKEIPAGALDYSGPLKDAAEKMTLSPDGTRIAVDGSGGHLQLIDATSLKLIKEFETGAVSGLDFAADGKSVLTAGPGNDLFLWNLETGKSTRTLSGHAGEVRAVVCSPDGSRAASTDAAGTLRIWDMSEGKLLYTMTGKKYPDDPPTDSITTEGLAFSPDGRFIITEANDVKARVWDAAHGTELRAVPDHDGTTASVSISPSGALAASSRAGGLLRVWKVETAAIVRVLTGNEGDVTCSAFALDGWTVFSGAGDNTIRQWDIETGLELRRFKLASAPSALLCAPDGKRLFSLSPDGGIVAWDITAAPVASGKYTSSIASLESAWLALLSTDYDARADAMRFLLKGKDEERAASIKLILEKLNAGGVKEEVRKMQADLIAKLDDASYATRLKAAEDLKQLGHSAREMLTAALNNPSSEVRLKAAELLRDIGGASDSRGLLAIEIFRLMHSPAANDALQAIIAKGGPDAARAQSALSAAAKQ